MIEKHDKIVLMKLYTSNESDFIYERPDGTRYVQQKRKNSSQFYELNENKIQWWIILYFYNVFRTNKNNNT